MKIPKIKMLILDVDGTMTDNGIYIDENGIESKRYNAKDGVGIYELIKHASQLKQLEGNEFFHVKGWKDTRNILTSIIQTKLYSTCCTIYIYKYRQITSHRHEEATARSRYYIRPVRAAPRYYGKYEVL